MTKRDLEQETNLHTPQEFMQHIRRRWWWSEEPYWKYVQNGRGWAHAIEVHPGIFNLIWLLSGVRSVPQSFVPYAASAAWAMDNGMRITCDEKSLADLAFNMDLRSFTLEVKTCGVKLPVRASSRA